MSLALRSHGHVATTALVLHLAATACVKAAPPITESGAPDTLECMLRIVLTTLASCLHPIADMSFEGPTRCEALRGIPLLRELAVSRA